jgi:hypothetical protein
LQDLWEVYRKKKVSKEVAQLITGRWAASTGKNYDTVWNYWKPVYPYQFQVLDFLNKEFKRRNTASAVNQAISALASVLNVSMGDGFMLSADVLAYRKAVNIKCPTGPALVDIWNIAIIFTYMRKEKEVKLLSLAELQERCIILLRVDLFSRSSDLTRLFREQIVFTKDGCKVRFFKPKEWRAQGKLTMKEWTAWINMAKVTGQSSICPVMVLEQWLHRSRDIAPKETVDGKVQTNLFFTKMAQGTVKMEASQVAKVAKNYLARAGVPDKYTAQSIRAARQWMTGL